MVNQTLMDYENLKGVFSIVGNVSLWIKNKIMDMGLTFPNALSIILTICIGLILIVVGTKITNKIAKFLLWIFGFILIIGMLYSLFNR